MKRLLSFIVVLVLAIAGIGLSGCASEAHRASQNLSTAADYFEIPRRVVFYNGITNEYILVVEGLCSINADMADDQLELTCKTGPDQFKKHFLGLSDNVTYFAEQLEGEDVDVYHYRVVFRPKAILPDIELK